MMKFNFVFFIGQDNIEFRKFLVGKLTGVYRIAILWSDNILSVKLLVSKKERSEIGLESQRIFIQVGKCSVSMMTLDFLIRNSILFLLSIYLIFGKIARPSTNSCYKKIK